MIGEAAGDARGERGDPVAAGDQGRLGPPGHGSISFTDPFDNPLELATLGYFGEIEPGPPDLDSLAWR